MKVIAKYHALYDPPLLQLWIHDAPHRRMHIKTIQNYRKVLYEAVRHTSIGRNLPIDHDIDLDVLFVNGSSPDLGNLYLALEQALDDTTLTKPGIVLDDSQIQKVTMSKYFPGERKK
jgi:Holliday junction resolvase RusA-like endonuclease